MTKIVAVFTYRSIETILAEQGTQAWKANRDHARACQYVVMTRNQHGVPPKDGHPGIAAEGDEPHRSAFMIGRMSDVGECDGFNPNDPRWIFLIDKWAPLDIPDFWEKWRGPVKYMDLEDTGIDLESLDWQDVPPRGEAQRDAQVPANRTLEQIATEMKLRNGPRAISMPGRLMPPRSIEQIAAELRAAIASERGVPMDAVKLNVSVVKVEETFTI